MQLPLVPHCFPRLCSCLPCPVAPPPPPLIPPRPPAPPPRPAPCPAAGTTAGVVEKALQAGGVAANLGLSAAVAATALGLRVGAGAFQARVALPPGATLGWPLPPRAALHTTPAPRLTPALPHSPARPPLQTWADVFTALVTTTADVGLRLERAALTVRLLRRGGRGRGLGTARGLGFALPLHRTTRPPRFPCPVPCGAERWARCPARRRARAC